MSHVEMLDVMLDRKDFTRHGMHLNSIGKEKFALLIGQHLINLLTKQENNILSLPWIDDSKDSNSMKEKDGIMLSLERFPNKVRVLERSKKPPVTRTDDFFMVNQLENVKVKFRKLSCRSVSLNNSNRFNREDSTQCCNSKSESELEQLKNTNCCTLTGNELPLQSKPNSDQGNLCIDSQYDKRKLLIFHQNIRGLSNKTNEILCNFLSESPHFLCFTEHHLSVSEIQSVHIDSYTLGAYYCRNQMWKGGVCIFVKNVINYTALNLETYSTDKDLEVCAIQLNISSKKFIF
jgi:hypothetical protein